MTRSEALRGAGILNSAFSPPVVTGKFSMIFFPVETVVTAILDEDGNDVAATYLKGSLTVAANTTIAVNGVSEGNYWSSIEISSGSANYTNA